MLRKMQYLERNILTQKAHFFFLGNYIFFAWCFPRSNPAKSCLIELVHQAIFLMATKINYNQNYTITA